MILAVLVGVVQGGTQALSRSLFASLIPRDKSGEFFGFFGVAEKFAGIFGPAIFGLVNLVSGSSRNSILSIIAFFVAGGFLLAQVDVAEGQRLARAEEAEALARRDMTGSLKRLGARVPDGGVHCFRQCITLTAHETPR